MAVSNVYYYFALLFLHLLLPISLFNYFGFPLFGMIYGGRSVSWHSLKLICVRPPPPPPPFFGLDKLLHDLFIIGGV